VTHIIAQDTSRGYLYVTAITRRGELVLGSDVRKEARKFTSEEEAKQVLEQTPSPKEGIEIIELMGPAGPYRPTSPLGFVLQACEVHKVENLEQLRAALPDHIANDLSDDNLWTLVKRQTELLVEWPWSVDLLLMQRHVQTDHHKSARLRKAHNHPAERDYETMEIVRPPKKGKHDHEDDLNRLRKEVRTMPTATKSKPRGSKAAPREKKEKVQRDCHCGCGTPTFANFTPGHDARIYAIFRKQAKGEKDAKFPKVLTDNKELFAAKRAKAH